MLAKGQHITQNDDVIATVEGCARREYGFL